MRAESLIILPILVCLVALEAWWLARTGGVGHTWRDTGANFAIGIGNRLAGVASAAVLAGLFAGLWEHRLFTMPETPWVFAGLMLVVDFLYYWFHRASHRVRWLWASHVVHHSSTRCNLSTAFRLGWTGLISLGWLFFLPAVVLGFPPEWVTGALALNLLYQFALHSAVMHSAVIGWLGPLGWVLNTPGHHRVHHACNGPYLDTNYGGILIVWDRLFGTFAAERPDAPLRFGTVRPLASHNPLVIAFDEWREIARDLRRGRWHWRTLLGPPGP